MKNSLKNSLRETQRRENREKSRAEYFYCPLENRRKSMSKIELNSSKKFKIGSIRKSTEISRQNSHLKY